MKIRLELQTKKFTAETIYSILEDTIYSSSVIAPDNITVNSNQANDCSILNIAANIDKIDNTENLIICILSISKKLLSDIDDISDQINTILIQIELEFDHFDFGLELENLHNILAGTKEYVDNSIVLSDPYPEITLSVFVDELSVNAKDKVIECVNYIINHHISKI